MIYYRLRDWYFGGAEATKQTPTLQFACLTSHHQFVEEIKAVKMTETDNFCLISEKKVKSKSLLKKAFKCDICHAGFSTKGNLEKHLKIHNGEKSFQCDYCEKKFTLKGDLTKHVKIHAIEREKPFQCEYCERKFSQKCNMKRHSTIHTRSLDD